MSQPSKLHRPARTIHTQYLCRVCNEPAGRADLDIFTNEAKLMVSGVVGKVTSGVAADRISHVENFLIHGTARDLFEWEYDSASFYCPTCDAVYCRAHWQIETVYGDEADPPGWYDCTYGTCPHGHRRMIDD